MQVQEQPTQANPIQTLLDLAGSCAVSRCLHVAADLGVADALDDAPQLTTDLARAVSADPDALGRVLRLLAGYGIFAVRGDGFTHTWVAAVAYRPSTINA